MRTSRKNLISLFFLFVFIAGAKPAQTNQQTKQKTKATKKPAKKVKTPTAEELQVMAQKLLCDEEIIGLSLTGLLRLARRDSIDLTPHWSKSANYKFNDMGVLEVKYAGTEKFEVVALPDPPIDPSKYNALTKSILNEKDFLSSVSAKHIPAELTKTLNLTKNLQLEVLTADVSGNASVDEFSWSFEYNTLRYSFGLRMPAPTNPDESIVYRPVVPHCQEETLEKFKQNYLPLKDYWTLSGVPTGEQMEELLEILKTYVPALKDN